MFHDSKEIIPRLRDEDITEERLKELEICFRWLH